nr:aminotransferase class I/II-fold pyridoxal phosphate-dependent enzyme [Chloroflexota bacterium]
QLARLARTYLADGLASVGLRCLPSRTNFWLVEVGDVPELRRRLLGRGILVRDCASFGLPRHVRLAARPLDACARLVETLSTVIPMYTER